MFRNRNHVFSQEKAAEANLQLTFFDDLDEADRGQAEEKFWLMVLRAGGMDPAAAFKVLKNYLSLRNAYPQYFAASAPPRKLKPVYEEQVESIRLILASGVLTFVYF